MTRPLQVAVIGAGLGGLTCALELQAGGCEVRLFEKSRGVGGRMATRRATVDDSAYAFDHGAQYFTARDPAFVSQVRRWEQEQLVARWEGRIGVLENGVLENGVLENGAPENDAPEEPQPAATNQAATERWVATPTMTAVAKSLAAALPEITHRRVARLQRTADGWRLWGEDDAALGTFPLVLSSAPAPQTAELLRDTPLQADCERCEIAPCWALMAAFPEPLPLNTDGLFINGHDALTWAARNNSKPGRPNSECWVAHASGPWTAQREFDAVDDVLPQLWTAFTDTIGELLPNLPAPSHLSAHRWRFALPAEPLTETCLWDPEWRLGACGDWCGGPRIEGAFLSGRALARKVLAWRVA